MVKGPCDSGAPCAVENNGEAAIAASQDGRRKINDGTTFKKVNKARRFNPHFRQSQTSSCISTRRKLKVYKMLKVS